MKKLSSSVLSVIAGILIIGSAQAHDPSKHKKATADKPNCAAMKNMDHSKMDAKDPVALAMMKKCKTDAKANNAEGHHQQSKQSEEAEKAEHSQH